MVCFKVEVEGKGGKEEPAHREVLGGNRVEAERAQLRRVNATAHSVHEDAAWLAHGGQFN